LCFELISKAHNEVNEELFARLLADLEPFEKLQKGNVISSHLLIGLRYRTTVREQFAPSILELLRILGFVSFFFCWSVPVFSFMELSSKHMLV
ncbi:MAG: hypothetical protein ACK56I_06810, partial [bacterium]